MELHLKQLPEIKTTIKGQMHTMDRALKLTVNQDIFTIIIQILGIKRIQYNETGFICLFFH